MSHHQQPPTTEDLRSRYASIAGSKPKSCTNGWARLSSACATAITWERSGHSRELTNRFVNSRPPSG